MSEPLRYTDRDLDNYVQKVEQRWECVARVSRVIQGDQELPIVDVVRSDEFGTVVRVSPLAAPPDLRRALDLANRLEHQYDFQCEGGPLKHCVEWQELRALLALWPRGEEK